MRKGILLLLPLAAMLSACWQSSEQLILAGDAAAPNLAGSYTFTTGTGETQSVTILADSDRYFIYDTTDSSGTEDKRQLRFLQLSGGWYLVQAQSIIDGFAQASANFRIIHIGSDGIDEYDPGCTSDDTRFTGVTFDDGDCTFTDPGGLRAAAQAYVDNYDNGHHDVLAYAGRYTR